MGLAHIGDGERAAGSVQRIGAAFLVLGLAKVRQHILEGPAGIAELPPVVEILVLAADIEQAVDGTRAAEHFAARLNDFAVVQFGFRLRCVAPIDPGVVEQFAKAERNVNPDVAVGAAGLQQQYAMTAGCGETIGENATSRAGPNDNVVEGL